MNSPTSWSVDGIDPNVRQRAEAAARRAGMSLADWLDASIADQPPLGRTSKPLPPQEAKEVAEIHNRLDSITRQIEQMSGPAPRAEPGVARQLNDAISRLDARLSQISEPAPKADAPKPMMASPSISPSLEDAIAELAARQNELSAGPRPAAPYASHQMPTPAKPAGADIAGLEQQLRRITGQIESLQRPDQVEQSIAAFRADLADIRNVITEAMPRRAIESIENEIRSLSRRIDDSRQNGTDGKALANIERALADIKDVLRSLTPAEQLAGFDDAIRNLGGKIDMIVRANGDPGTIEQLEGAIAALRAIVSNVASNESLGRLSDDVRLLAEKVDQFSRPDAFSEGFAALEQRIAALTTTLEKRPAGVIPSHSEHLEGALQALSDRLDHLPVGNDSTSAFSHLEQRVSYLLERLEMNTDHRANNLGRVEEGLQDILRHLEKQTATFAGFGGPPLAPAGGMDPALVEQIKRELSEMRFSQTETDRHTQDSLEVVHNTLGHVVDRLAMIEGDLRAARAAPAVAPAAAVAPAPAKAAMQRPELPNPVARPVAAPMAIYNDTSAAAAVAAPRAISDILDQQPTPAMREPAAYAEPHQPRMRPVLDPDLPPDHPLEPGTLPHGLVATPSPRIGEPAAGEPASTSSFIAAARRAAQAASSAPANDKAKRATKPARDKTAEPSTITTKIRSLLVGASVVVIVLGSFKMAMNLLDGSTQPPAETSSDAPPPLTLAPPESSARPMMPLPATPSITSPTPIGRQSLVAPQPTEPPFAGVPLPAATQTANADITGSIPQQLGSAASLPPAGRKPAQIAIPATEKLPDAIAGPVLRAAAMKGDPAAAYEIGVRFAEARGVPANFDEAAKWYDRAAQAGIVPAMFRIGTLYEKGLSVKKDTDTARKYYTAAAERGNAKAMHNLAVLDADGGGNGANYKGAAQWFRKAADRGVADSQYNLGILYARGIGVEQNLAESFKWFSLAAAQGDADSGAKRDDVAKRLDPQSLAAAKLAIQTFTAEPQPDDAVTVASPAGGWDNAGAPAAKPATAKRAAR